MKITKLTKRLGRNINTGNFSSIRIEVELEATLHEGDSLAEVDEKLYEEACEILAKDRNRIKEQRNASKNA